MESISVEIRAEELIEVKDEPAERSCDSDPTERIVLGEKVSNIDVLEEEMHIETLRSDVGQLESSNSVLGKENLGLKNSVDTLMKTIQKISRRNGENESRKG